MWVTMIKIPNRSRVGKYHYEIVTLLSTVTCINRNALNPHARNGNNNIKINNWGKMKKKKTKTENTRFRRKRYFVVRHWETNESHVLANVRSADDYKRDCNASLTATERVRGAYATHRRVVPTILWGSPPSLVES